MVLKGDRHQDVCACIFHCTACGKANVCFDSRPFGKCREIIARASAERKREVKREVLRGIRRRLSTSDVKGNADCESSSSFTAYQKGTTRGNLTAPALKRFWFSLSYVRLLRELVSQTAASLQAPPQRPI